MLVRWSPVPEAERNGLLLGYKVSPAPGSGGGRGSLLASPSRVPCSLGLSLCLQSGLKGSVWLLIHRSPWQPESSLRGWAGRGRGRFPGKAWGPWGCSASPRRPRWEPKPHSQLRWAQRQFLSPSRIPPQSQTYLPSPAFRSLLCHYWLCDLEQVTRPLWACFPTWVLSKETPSSLAECVFGSPPPALFPPTPFPTPPWGQSTARSPSLPAPSAPRPLGRGLRRRAGRAEPGEARSSPGAGLRQVLYREKDSDPQPRVWLVEGNASLSVQLTGLGKYVLYEVQVLAFTRIGDGSPSRPPVLERTLDDGECRPCPRPSGVTGCSWEKPVAGGHHSPEGGC